MRYCFPQTGQSPMCSVHIKSVEYMVRLKDKLRRDTRSGTEKGVDGSGGGRVGSVSGSSRGDMREG